MKILTSLALLAAATAAPLAAAADLVCTATAQGQASAESFELKIHGDEFQVRHYSTSRNTYSATYSLPKRIPTRVGWQGALVKTHDDSTWQDMPAELALSYVEFGSGPDATGYRLGGLADDSVWFGSSSCVETPEPTDDGCPPGQHPGHCPSRNCGSCG